MKRMAAASISWAVQNGTREVQNPILDIRLATPVPLESVFEHQYPDSKTAPVASSGPSVLRLGTAERSLSDWVRIDKFPFRM